MATHLEDYGKQVYLEERGYEWDAQIESYVNKDTWKIFSKEYLDDHPFDLVMRDLQQASEPGHWQIYANTEVPEDLHNIRKHYGITTEGTIIK